MRPCGCSFSLSGARFRCHRYRRNLSRSACWVVLANAGQSSHVFAVHACCLHTSGPHLPVPSPDNSRATSGSHIARRSRCYLQWCSSQTGICQPASSGKCRARRAGQGRAGFGRAYREKVQPWCKVRTVTSHSDFMSHTVRIFSSVANLAIHAEPRHIGALERWSHPEDSSQRARQCQRAGANKPLAATDGAGPRGGMYCQRVYTLYSTAVRYAGVHSYHQTTRCAGCGGAGRGVYVQYRLVARFVEAIRSGSQRCAVRCGAVRRWTSNISLR